MSRVIELATQIGKPFEGCKLEAYLCPAKKWTIGWGNTFFEDGTPVKRGDKITQLRAETLHLYKLAEFESGVRRLVKSRCTDFQLAALVDFAYNVGLDIDADTIAEGFGDSTLLRLVNANPNDPRIFKYVLDKDGIAKTGSCEFLRWVNKGTSFERGLRRRNQARCDMYTRRA
jgi:lysozyme